MNLQQIINLLRSYDHALFFKINSEWANSYADMYFPNITDLHRNPVALLVLPIAIVVWIFRQRLRAIKGLMALIIAIAASDLFSYRVVKTFVTRDRPVAAGLPIERPVVLRSEHHSGSSFPSNHAANVFATATMVTLLWPPYFLIAFLIAGSVAYSRVYVGVHFPSDILAGALIGFFFARFVWSMMGHWIDRIDYTDGKGRSHYSISRDRE